MFIIVFHIYTRSSPIYSEDFYTVLSQGMRLIAWEFLLFSMHTVYTSFRVCIFIPATIITTM